MSKKYLKQSIIALLSLGLIFLANSVIWAWTAPTQSPPAGNVAAPVNVSSVAQNKAGDLAIGPNLKYWITQYYDSFALKNNAGAIKFIVGQDGHIGIGTDAPVGLLDVGENACTYKIVGLSNGYFGKTPRCSCDVSGDTGDCVSPFGLNRTFSALDVGSVCYDWYAGWMGAKCDKQGDASFARYFNVQNGKIKMGSQTVDSDSSDTVTTKGYVDSKAAADFKWFTFTYTGVYLKDGAKADVTCSAGVPGRAGTAEFKIENGKIYTKITIHQTGDCGWQKGWQNTCIKGDSKGVAEATEGGGYIAVYRNSPPGNEYCSASSYLGWK